MRIYRKRICRDGEYARDDWFIPQTDRMGIEERKEILSELTLRKHGDLVPLYHHTPHDIDGSDCFDVY